MRNRVSLKECAPKIALVVALLAFIGISLAYFKTKFDALPALAAAVVGLFIFLFKGKYRIYVMAFAISFVRCMTFHTWKLPISSMFLIVTIVYVACSLFQYLSSPDVDEAKFIRVVSPYLLFMAFLLVVEIVNITSVDIPSFVSGIVYWSLPIAFIFDNRAEKKVWNVAIYFALGILFSNLFMFAFVYVFKSQTVEFLELFLPNYVKEFQHYGLSTFRFPGLVGDSNSNGLNIIVASLLLVLSLDRKSKFQLWITVPLVIAIQIFAVLGQSKAYLFCLVVTIVLFVCLSIKKPAKLPYYLLFLLMTLSFAFVAVINIPAFANLILRFLSIDTRAGLFIYSLTTQRSAIVETYLNASLADPLRLFIGHGAFAAKLGTHYHNSYVQSIWEFGIIGSLLYLFHIKRLLPDLKPFLKEKKLLLPMVLIFLYAASLHIINHESLLPAIFIYRLILESKKELVTSKNNQFKESYEIKKEEDVAIYEIEI